MLKKAWNDDDSSCFAIMGNFFLRKYFATQLWFMTYHILYLWHMKSYIISMRYDIIHHIYEICFHMSYIWIVISNYRNFETTLFWTPKRWRQKKNSLKLSKLVL
jgi:hypothetical protein